MSSTLRSGVRLRLFISLIKVILSVVIAREKLESVEVGKIELAVEHFRPKSKVTRWRLPSALGGMGIALTNVQIPNGGDYLLAYDIRNYCAACGPCNTALKRNYFPIAGIYDFTATDSMLFRQSSHYCSIRLRTMQEQFIEFYGISPRPASQHGHARNRALVTIEFFKLDDANKRKNLIRERAQLLTAIFPQLEAMCGDGTHHDKTDSPGAWSSPT